MLGFNGPNPDGKDLPSNTNPIQHFQWWDARINTEDRGTDFTYEVYPVVDTKDDFALVEDKKTTITFTIPQVEEKGIGTYFNRAVVSSQAFAKEFTPMTVQNYHKALAWLSNGMNEALVNFITGSAGQQMYCAAYHLTDNEWIVPALKQFDGSVSVDYFYKAPSGVTGKRGR